MLSLHTNNASLSAQNSIGRTQKQLSTSMNRLSTGYRINSAMDDAAGMQIATRLKSQTSGMAVAMRNTQNSISMLQTAEGALDEVSNMLIHMKDLAAQSADASASTDDKWAMQSEYDTLGLELANILKNTTFGGTTLLVDGTVASAAGMTFQIGPSSNEQMTVNLAAEMTTMDSKVSDVSVTYDLGPTVYGADMTINPRGAMARADIALREVGKVRSALGAVANRLEHVFNNLSNISINTKAATGLIMDVDFATESATVTSNQMLLQASTSMLKQTNSMSSMIVSLLQ